MGKIKIGIIICSRYRNCGGGKCLRSMNEREGAFDIYKGQDIMLAGYAQCGGCPGGNIEYVPAEMKRNGVDTIHFATGMIIGYPPCRYIDYFREFIEKKFSMRVVYGTHPIPTSYYDTHKQMNYRRFPDWEERTKLIICDEAMRNKYN